MSDHPRPVVVVTGATGFLGGAFVAEALLSREVRVIAIARGPEAALRVRVSLQRFRDLDAARAELWVVEADLGEPGVWSEGRLATAQPLRASGAPPSWDEVTHVVHLAANTSFRSVRDVRRVNVDATLALAEAAAKAPALRRFVHVGTAFACGDAPGRVLAEDGLPSRDVRHPVPYTATKAEAEHRLASLTSLPLVVACPSVVVGHTTLGCEPSASLFWFYRVLHALRRTPRALDALEDVVPVDWVTVALAHLTFAPELRHRRYHLSAGLGSSVSFGEVMQAFDRAYGTPTHEPFELADAARLRRERERLTPRLGVGDEERLLFALELYLRFAELPVEVFDNARLLAEGVPPPPRFTEWIGACARDPRTVWEMMRDDG